MMGLTHKTLKPAPLELRQLDQFLAANEHNWEEYAAPGAIKRCKAEGVVFTYYRNGTLLLQGKGTHALLEELWPHYLGSEQPAKRQNTEQPVQVSACIGADESGKGDYFGPLVTAAVYITAEQDSLLKEIGVRDSKALSDKRITSIYPDVLENCISKVEVLMPYDYNTVYPQVNNLNTLLAQLHKKNIVNLVAATDCDLVIVDKFAKESVLLNELQLKRVQVKQYPKAESKYTAVAAASIIARANFVYAMQDLENKHDTKLPKGAGNVIATGVKLVRQHGTEILNSVAKLHFKTTQDILQRV